MSPQPNFQGPSFNNNKDTVCAGEPLKNEKFSQQMKNPPKQDDFEGRIPKYQIGSVLKTSPQPNFQVSSPTNIEDIMFQGQGLILLIFS